MGQTDKQKVGNLGESIACRFLEGRRFKIVERNYLKKCGEIDVIASKQGILYFVEVKTVSHFPNEYEAGGSHPEDNIHPWKLQRLSRTIQTYLLEKNISENTEWRFDVVVVFLDQRTKKAKIRFLENVIL